jgi:acetyltransferase-like isoleucine patch superfamily enzyme
MPAGYDARKFLIQTWHKLAATWQIKSDPVGYARSIGVKVGKDCRLLGLDRGTFGTEPYLIRLGDHVSLTNGVRFVTHDGGVWVFREEHPEIDVISPIVVGSNVYFGNNSLVLPGVTIGDHCVIGAGSVVTRDVPSGTVVAGVPARPIRTLEEYWNRVKDKSFHIRSKPLAERRRILVDHFAKELSDSGTG